MNQATEGFSLINAFLNFASLGAEWVMWLLVALGFGLLVVVLERLRLYHTTRVDAPGIARALVPLLDQGRLDDARQVVARGRAMEERVLADALEAWPQGPVVVDQIIKSAVAREQQRYDRFLNFLGTLGNNAPFVGLFGTVVGIIVAFKELASNPKGGLEVVGPGIAEALVATAVGLFVAIPAVVAFNAFKGMLKKRLGNSQFLGGIVLATLNRDAKQG